MSFQRGKRFHKLEDDQGPATLSRLYCEPYAGNVYNKSTHSKPAELFRKDLISAMKLPDSEQLQPDEYWFISDPWKQEWEKGVQVPVNPEGIPEACLKNLSELEYCDGTDRRKSLNPMKSSNYSEAQVVNNIGKLKSSRKARGGSTDKIRSNRRKEKAGDFKLPKNLIRSTHDEFFSNEIHQLHNTASKAEQVCRYDLDDVDVKWLRAFNREREDMGLPPVEELTLEKVMEELEIQCHDNIQHAIQTEKGLGIEYDEDVICDVCRSPDSEEGNEMVFCDSCDICVHQACYGIQTIPDGSWVCRTCSLGMKPVCLLCPRRGGAMKSTRTGSKWTHVSCALWIPEVSIGCVEKMEPIIKISHIPASRWALVCNLCRERTGACIQCSIKSCKIAYHVTCAFLHGLEMKAILDDQDSEDGVKLRSYCQKHSKKNGVPLPESETEVMKIIPKKELTSEEKATQRETRLQQIEEEFYKFVNIQEVASTLEVDEEIVDFVCEYWKLKRKAAFCKALLTPKKEEADLLTKQQEDSLYARMKMFVHLRQDLERVRNLCYMVSRREKLSRTWFKIREQIFLKQVATLTSDSLKLSKNDIETILKANHGKTIYDKSQLWDRESLSQDSSLNEYVGVSPKETKIDPTTNHSNKTHNELNSVSKGCKSAKIENSESEKRFERNKSQFKTRTRTNGMFGGLEKSSKTLACYLKKTSEVVSDKERLSSSPSSNSSGKNSRYKQSVTTKSGSTNKDFKMQEMSPNREKLRQESVKVRETLFTNQGSPRALSGYKIPKKSKNDISVSSLENHDRISSVDKEQNSEGNLYNLETRSSSQRTQSEPGRQTGNWPFDRELSIQVFRTTDKSSHTKELRKSTSDSNNFEHRKENEIADFRTLTNHKYDGSEASMSDCESETSNSSQTNYNQKRGIPKTYAMRSRLFEAANKITASGYR